MWNKPNQKQLAQIPPLYSSEDTPIKDKVIYLHFFMLPCFDWYVAEYDGQDTFFGFANLCDPDMAEWGYASYQWLKDLRFRFCEVETDKFWRPQRFADIERLKGFNLLGL